MCCARVFATIWTLRGCLSAMQPFGGCVWLCQGYVYDNAAPKAAAVWLRVITPPRQADFEH
jgi:hypothetical protein